MKLQQRATQMIEFARQHPYVAGEPLLPYRHELPRGLTLLYVIEAGLHHLALTRCDVAPSEFEIDICRRAFAVPDHADRHDKQKGQYYHVAISWPNEPPPPVLATITYPANSPWLGVPAGSWERNADGSITVRYTDAEELRWSVLASAELKQVLAEKAAPLHQSTMFETKSDNYYGER
jgi:hypothetical protein